MGLVPAVAATWNVIDLATVAPLLCTGFPLPSVAEVIVVCVGGWPTPSQVTFPVPVNRVI